MGLYSFCMSLEKSEDRTIRSSTMSQTLCRTIIPEFFICFQNKTQSLIVWDPRISQYMWYFWVSLEAFIPPIAKIYIYDGAYRSANNKDKHACNAYIVKSTNGSTENWSMQSNQGVHVYGIWWIGIFVIFVANLYFFENDSLYWNFSGKTWAIFILLFLTQGGGHLVPIVLIIGTLVHLLLLFLLLFFCIATCILWIQ